MTELLQQIIREAEKLPPEVQDAFARRWMQELAEERAWDGAFDRPSPALAEMADEAIRDYHEGHTKPLNLGDL
ncbi:MAG: hypothetical protein WKG32_12975 [Gemmatimonadaceae bacterium]